MEKDFWLERWNQGETGFHQHEINPYLSRYWQDLHPSNGNLTFVPLCGKSQDMHWLRKQGHSVLGVELSPVAVNAFFSESGVTPHRVTRNKFEQYESDSLTILCGDFFDLDKDALAKVSKVYDRASLVALPPDMRRRYVRHLTEILPKATQILLITYDYPQHEMSGPPFAVSVTEVEALFQNHAAIHLLSEHDVLVNYPRFQQRGVSRIQENIFLLSLL